MKYLISVLFILNTFALTVPKVYNTGKLIDVSRNYYLIQTKSKKLIKVKPFLENPKVGISITYPISNQEVTVDRGFLFDQASKLVSQEEYTSDIIEVYLKTLAEVSRNGLYKVESTNGSRYSFNLNNILDIIIPTACAKGQSCKNMCYFGGWPSTRKGGYCQAPWKVKSDSRVKAIDAEVYSNDFSCGGKNRFRCNPKIFGPYDSSLDPVQFVDTRKSKTHSGVGICIKASPSYSYATARCLEASSKVPNFKEALKERYNNSKETFDKLIDNVNCFCNSQKTDKKEFSCNALRSRLASIFEKPEKITTKERDTDMKIPVEDEGGKEKRIPVDGGDEKKVPIEGGERESVAEVVIEQKEEPLPKELLYYNCQFIGSDNLFEGKDANCSNKKVCMKKLACSAYSKEEKKFDIQTKLLAYCPCDERDATSCANAKADRAIKVNQETPNGVESNQQ